jgi:glutathione S-transferase
LVDCAAAPCLHYASTFEPFGARKKLAGYFDRLRSRPSFARVLKEAEPYSAMFPKEDA